MQAIIHKPSVGGFNNGGLKRMDYLARRSKRIDHTDYVAWNALQYATHWAQRISAAVVFGDAKRSLDHLDTLKRNLATSPAPAASPPTTAHRSPGGHGASFASLCSRDARKGLSRAETRGHR